MANDPSGTSSNGYRGLNPETADQTKETDPQKLRILVAEDDFLIALELENRLLDAGYEVVGIAVTAGEAVSMAGSEKPDLALMDIRIADQTDGVDAAITMFASFGIRSIFASAYADAETRKRAAAASPIGWIQKPYPADTLIRLIRHFLDQ